ncbi:MAG TPA: DUF1573 domain-containing protein [Chthoniobacterales bacterium]|jgi:hypothetical protein
MKTQIVNLIAFFVATSLTGIAQAELKWEQTQIELHPAPGDATAVGSFKYKNTGGAVVHFKSVTTSCGCTTAARKKDDVAPGETGEITATFKVGASTGTQQKTVRVETDDPASPVTILTLRAMIPQMLELRPSFVYWENSEPPKPKTILAKAAKELHANNLKVTSSSGEFVASVSSIGQNQFKIEVQPHDTSHPVSATLTVQPDSGGKPVYATARVVNPPSTQ